MFFLNANSYYKNFVFDISSCFKLLQTDNARIVTLFISLMVHKIIVAFSVGLQLGRTHAHALGWVCLSMALFSIMSPFGGFIGTFVQSSQMDTQVKALTILTFQGVAVGTFIYVTFFEVRFIFLFRRLVRNIFNLGNTKQWYRKSD